MHLTSLYPSVLLCCVFLLTGTLLTSCHPDKPQQKDPKPTAVETLPEGPLYKLFTAPDAEMQIQLDVRALVEKAALSDSLLLPMAHDCQLIADSLIARLPIEAQAFLDGFSPVDGWSESLLPTQVYDLAIVSQDEQAQPAYLTALFTEGDAELRMFNYKAFNSMYTFPDDLEMIQLPRQVGTFSYKVQGDTLITAHIHLVQKEQNALLTLRQISEQLSTDEYDSDDYLE